jgi:hypothetical protein
MTSRAVTSGLLGAPTASPRIYRHAALVQSLHVTDFWILSNDHHAVIAVGILDSEVLARLNYVLVEHQGLLERIDKLSPEGVKTLNSLNPVEGPIRSVTMKDLDAELLQQIKQASTWSTKTCHS